jgi:hypothetical protein
MTATDRRPETLDMLLRIDGIPHNYDELFDRSGRYPGIIANEIRRKNVVAGNFEDHYQSVCEKICAARVLEKFAARVLSCSDDDLPATMTGADACKLFGIKFPAWRSKMWSFHKVFKEDLGGQVPVEGKTHGTITRASGAVVSWIAWMPTPISGSYSSPKAVYNTSDVLECPDRAPFKGMTFDTSAWPKRQVQPHHFVSYLLRAVNNHFSNACRTIMRRHKDRPGDHFSQFKSPDGEFNPNWEDGLPDPMNSAASIEASCDLNTAIDAAVKMTVDQKGEISGFLATGHTIIEAVKMSSLAPEQKKVLLTIADA